MDNTLPRLTVKGSKVGNELRCQISFEEESRFCCSIFCFRFLHPLNNQIKLNCEILLECLILMAMVRFGLSGGTDEVVAGEGRPERRVRNDY